MKKFVFITFLLLAPMVSLGFVVPEKPQNYASDYAGILSGTEITSLESKLRAFEQQSSNEIAVVILQTLDGETIEDVAQQIFTAWGIGKEDENNGVLLLIA